MTKRVRLKAALVGLLVFGFGDRSPLLADDFNVGLSTILEIWTMPEKGEAQRGWTGMLFEGIARTPKGRWYLKVFKNPTAAFTGAELSAIKGLLDDTPNRNPLSIPRRTNTNT